MIQTVVAEAKRYCQDVEFAAQDATRAEPDFLRSAIEAAVDAGRTCVTVCDSAGTMPPDEFSAFVKTILQMVPSGVRVGAACSNTLNIACACSFAAMQAGCTEIKVSAACRDLSPLEAMAQIIRHPGRRFDMACSIRSQSFSAPFSRSSGSSSLSGARPRFANALPDTDRADLSLNSFDDRAAVDTAVMKLGHDLSEEDSEKVYAEFLRLAEKDGRRQGTDAIVASACGATGSGPTYQPESYLINSGSVIRASANIQIKKGEKSLRASAWGDGPIDAAFFDH